MPKYTIKQATPTGKVDPKYGTEYLVQFNEDERTVKLSRLDAVTPGREENGTIVDNPKYGAYFKKDPYVRPPEANSDPVKKQWTPMKKDNSDGQRQGMCINNAGNYVNSLEFKDASGNNKALTDREWATLVFSYAQALYRLGDLKQAPEGSQEVIQTVPANIADVFGVNGAPSAS